MISPRVVFFSVSVFKTPKLSDEMPVSPSELTPACPPSDRSGDKDDDMESCGSSKDCSNGEAAGPARRGWDLESPGQ